MDENNTPVLESQSMNIYFLQFNYKLDLKIN